MNRCRNKTSCQGISCLLIQFVPINSGCFFSFQLLQFVAHLNVTWTPRSHQHTCTCTLVWSYCVQCAKSAKAQLKTESEGNVEIKKMSNGNNYFLMLCNLGFSIIIIISLQVTGSFFVNQDTKGQQLGHKLYCFTL